MSAKNYKTRSPFLHRLTHTPFVSHFADNNRPELYSPYSEVYVATRTDVSIKERVDTLDVFFLNWSTEFIHGLEHDLRRKHDLDQNIFLAFLATQSITWDWMAFGLQCGHYSAVARELRSILESAVLFIQIELKMTGALLSDKISAWQTLEDDRKSHGKQVFKDSGLPNWTQHYALYRELCGYTHASIGTYRSDVELMASSGQMLLPFYSRTAFNAIFDFWTRVVQVVTEATKALYADLGQSPECCAINPMDADLVRRQR